MTSAAEPVSPLTITTSSAPADRIDLFRFHTPQMRAFHLSWIAFFLCFFSWFGLAPLMPVIRKEFGLTKSEIGWLIIGSVAVTVLFRLMIGRLCDLYGPRKTYSWLLILGAIPVMGVGLAYDFTTFLIGRVLIGAIGASFVITQYHTSRMFASNCVGSANAITAGWGNLGGGVTQLAMPLLFALITSCGATSALSWRLCMVIAGMVCALTGIMYWRYTQDTPAGNFSDLDESRSAPNSPKATFAEAARDYRVWSLAALYACCFGLELTLDNVAVLYFTDYFHLDMYWAGAIAAGFGMMNLFARALGGILSDRWAKTTGLDGRGRFLFLTILGEGTMLLLFSLATNVWVATCLLLVVGLFVKMSNGAVYSIVPFINRRALGSVAGIVGAGGNVGAVLAGFLFQSGMSWPTVFTLLGLIVCAASCLAFVSVAAVNAVKDQPTVAPTVTLATETA